MSNDWSTFISQYSNPLKELKSSLNITIYGSYHPDEELFLLQSLRDELIADGYTLTKIVQDRQKPDDDPLELSQQSMLFSDINLLVFTSKGKRYGIVDELTFLTSDSRMVHKIQFSRVFDQILDERSSVPDLSQSRIKSRGIQVKKFETKEELKVSIVKETYWIMRGWAWTYRNMP